MKLAIICSFLFSAVCSYAQSQGISNSPVNTVGLTLSNFQPKNSEFDYPQAGTMPVSVPLFSSKEELIKYCNERSITFSLTQESKSDQNIQIRRAIGQEIIVPLFMTRAERENYCRAQNISLSIIHSDPAINPSLNPK